MAPLLVVPHAAHDWAAAVAMNLNPVGGRRLNQNQEHGGRIMSGFDVDRLRGYIGEDADGALAEEAADEIDRLRSAIHGKQGWVDEYASLQCLLVQERMGRESTDNSNTDLHGEIDRLQKEIDRITEGVRYWSYCMNQGMREGAPEECSKLADFLISLKIAPYYLPS